MVIRDQLHTKFHRGYSSGQKNKRRLRQRSFRFDENKFKAKKQNHKRRKGKNSQLSISWKAVKAIRRIIVIKIRRNYGGKKEIRRYKIS